MADSEPVSEERRQESRNDFGSSLRDAALEAGLVVLGVVLAFAANEWRKGQEDAERARLALDAVTHELQANRGAVAESEEYHYAKMVALRDAREGAEPLEPRDFEKGFVHPAQILSNAWDTATATDAVLGWDYDQLLTVSRLYANQGQYEVQTHGVVQVIYGHLLSEGTRGVTQRPEQLHSILSSFWWRECQLLATYADVLPQLASEVPEAPERCPPGTRGGAPG